MLNKYEPSPQSNYLLAALSTDIQSRLFPHLELANLTLYEVLYESNRTISCVYFPVDSLITIQYLMQNGESTAITVVGKEGLLGSNLVMGSKTTLSRSIVQIAGFAYKLPKQLVVEEFNRHGQMMKLMLCYTHCFNTQVAQTAVCNRRHSILEQLCRWLLLSLDRLEHNDLAMTQECISNMLGVRREGVTEAACILRDEGVIKYTRGKIHIIDRQKLEDMTCECYSMVKTETDKLLDYWPNRELIKKPESIPFTKAKHRLVSPNIQRMKHN